MARLKAMPARVGALAPRLAALADAHGHSKVREFWRPWYSLARWERVRRVVFKRDHYACQMPGCGQVTARPVADHIKAHRGDPALFWDDANVQTLCKPCHDTLKQAEESAARRVGG